MISYKNDIKNFWYNIQNTQLGILITNYLCLAYFLAILKFNLSKKSVRIFFYFLFYIIFKVMFLLLFYLWIYDIEIIDTQPMVFPKSNNETEVSEEEKLIDTAKAYSSINCISLAYLLIFNFCLIYIDKILFSNLDLANESNNIYYYNNNNTNYEETNVGVITNSNQNNKNIEKTSILIGGKNISVQIKTDENIYLEETTTKKNIYLNKYY